MSVKAEAGVNVKAEATAVKHEHTLDAGSAEVEDDFSVPRKLGQKMPTPSPGTGERVFYESLLKEKPDSFIAVKWCVEHGIFPRDQCERMVEKLEKLKVQDKERQDRLLRLQIAHAGAASTAASGAPAAKKARKGPQERSADDVEVDAGLAVTTHEGVGMVAGL